MFLGRNRQYAERHGYGYVLVDDESVRRALDGEPLHWGKVPALRSILATLSPIDDDDDGDSTTTNVTSTNYDYLLWLDADCMVVNFEQRLEPFVHLDAQLQRAVAGPRTAPTRTRTTRTTKTTKTGRK